MSNTLILLAVVLFLPLLAWLLRSAFAWRYQRMLRAGMARGSLEPADPTRMSAAGVVTPSRPLRVVVADASDLPVGAAAQHAFRRATEINHRAQLAFATAVLLNGVVVAVGMYFALDPAITGYRRMALLYLALAPSVAIAVRVTNLRWSQLTIAVAAYAVVGLVLLRLAVSWNLIFSAYATAAEVFALLPTIGALGLLSRQLRPVIVGFAALLVFLVLNFTVAALLSTFQVVDVSSARAWVWVLASVNLIGGILLVAWLLGRDDWKRPLAYVLVGAALTSAAEWLFMPSVRLGLVIYGVLSNAAQVWLVWLIFRVFIGLWQRGRWSEQIVHAHVAVGFVDVYFLFFALVARTLFTAAWAAASIPLAFVLYMVALHLQLRRIRASKSEPPLALLYLRAFTARDLSASPLRWLEDRWRRVGRVDLIAGTDVGLEALGPRMIQRLLQRRAYSEFVTRPARLAEELESSGTTMGGDARYPVSAFYCYADTWRASVERLATRTDVVLMDLREFARAHRGCAFELATLVRQVLLGDIVLIADARTDVAAIESIAQEAWSRLPVTSPNAGNPNPILTLVRLDGPPSRHDASMTERLLEAAFTDSRAAMGHGSI
jgi:hypothetical protein